MSEEPWEEFEQLIRSALAEGPTSPPFRERLKRTVMEELKRQRPGWVRTQVIEALIGRALSDLGFRRSLLEDPQDAARQAGFVLTPQEVAAFKDMSEEMVESFGGALDERASKRHRGGFPPDFGPGF